MTGPTDHIVGHYAAGGLYERIIDALARNGVAAGEIGSEDLKYIDEFHIGGRAATEALLDPLDIPQGCALLDIGSGIGGPARHISDRYGASVTGIDLTPDFVETAERLSADLGVPVRYVVGSALDMPFADDAFDVATLLHVGMNLPDKARLFAEVARVLKPGGTFAVYDVMLFGAHPDFPLPWASTPEGSFLEAPGIYLDAAKRAGFELIHRRDRGGTAREFFAQMQERMARDGPPVVGPPLLMGETAPAKVGNMVASVGKGDIAPVEMIFRSRGAN